jgi:hypothetical protein
MINQPPSPYIAIYNALAPDIAYSRILSGVAQLLNAGNSIRSVARQLGIAEGTLRRGIINQERMPSVATLQQAYVGLARLGQTDRTPGRNVIRDTPIIPGAEALRNIFPPNELRTFTAVVWYEYRAGDLEETQLFEGYRGQNPKEDEDLVRVYLTVGPFTLGIDQDVYDVIAGAGYPPDQVVQIIWKT